MMNLLLTKKIAFTLICICVFSTSFSQQTLTETIQHDGLTRGYIIYIPSTYASGTDAPLVLNFHGYTSNAQEQIVYGDFRTLAEQHGFIVVHPDGVVDGAGNTHFNVGWGNSAIDDVGFVSTLLDDLIANYDIDDQRIYSTGMSNGGFMSYRLACEMSDRIAAIASVTGSMTLNTPNTCAPSRAVPIMEIHGTSDGTVPYNGANFSEPIADVLDFWVGFNNTDASPTVTALADTDTSDNSTVEYIVYSNGDNDATVEHYKVANGGHSWPGSAIDLPTQTTNYDFNASEVIWNFFSRYDMNGEISTLSTTDFIGDDIEVSVYPNPVSDSYIHVASNFTEQLDYKLMSATGQLVLSGVITSNNHKINMDKVAQGLYFLTIGNTSYKILKAI